jgi:hypothetical protein
MIAATPGAHDGYAVTSKGHLLYLLHLLLNTVKKTLCWQMSIGACIIHTPKLIPLQRLQRRFAVLEIYE